MSTEHMPENIDQLLLDYHMGLLEPADRVKVEQILKSRPDAIARSERIGQTLQPLSAWKIPTTPKNLVQSVLDRIDRCEDTIMFEPARNELGTGSDTGIFRSVLALREVLAIAASILIIVGVFVPSYYGVRGRGQAANPTQQVGADVGGILGRDFGDYYNHHIGYQPYGGGQPGAASWLPPVSEQTAGSGTTTRKVTIVIKRPLHLGQVLFPSHFSPETDSIPQDDTGDSSVQTALPLVIEPPSEANAVAPLQPQ